MKRPFDFSHVDYIMDLVVTNIHDLKVYNNSMIFVLDGVKWDVQRMIQHIPLELVNKIISMVPPTSVNGTNVIFWHNN